MPATTKAQTAKANAAAETFTDAEGDSRQLAQVLAALNGLTAKFAGVETTVSDLAARQVALESAHITGIEAADAVLAEPELEPEAEPESAPEAGGGVGAVSAEVKLAQLEQQLAVLTAQTAAGASVHTGRQADPKALACVEDVPLAEMWSQGVFIDRRHDLAVVVLVLQLRSSVML